MTYISEQGKSNLFTYKYIGSDNSYLSALLQPFWNKVVEFVPLSIAPNTITLSGFLLLVISYLLTAYYTPNAEGSSPTWLYFIHALFLFLYQTLDAIDGKQARRTKSSSPLGELFDHGCDSISGMTTTMTTLSVAQSGPTWIAFTHILSVHAMFFFSIWEQYFTETLTFQAFSGPTEAQYFAISVYLATMIMGHGLWTYELFPTPAFLSQYGIKVQLRTLAVPFILISTVTGIYGCVKTVQKKEKELTAEQMEKKGSLIGVAFPYLFLTACFVQWALVSPQDILVNHIFLLCSIYGLVAAYVTTRVVLARVCQETVGAFHLILAPLPLILLNAMAPKLLGMEQFVSEYTTLVLYAIFVVALYAHMVVSVITDICNHLGIRCFSLKHLHAKQQ